MTFGNQCDEKTSFQIMDRAADAGINFLDAADGYPFPSTPETAGRTEEIVGNWLRGKRQHFVLASKAGMRMGHEPNEAGLSRKHILEAIDGSLRRLSTDYLDLYQTHFPDPDTPIDETLSALDVIVKSGRARYIGCSNLPAWQLCKALWTSDRFGFARYESTQARYNLLYRDIEFELAPLCVDQRIGILAYNPLAGGLLTGKYDRMKSPPANTRFAIGGKLYTGRYWNNECFNAVEQLRNFLEPRGKSLSHAALLWLLHQPVITSVIVGATSAEQLAETMRYSETSLDAHEIERCGNIWFDMGDVVEVREA